jgi:GPI ethanolamine phosphate transferase 3 subunit O
MAAASRSSQSSELLRPICSVLMVLVMVSLLHASGLFLYTRGFLLARFELPNCSTCHTIPNTANAAACWMPSLYKRVIFIVIDALRYDFATHHDDNEANANAHTTHASDAHTKHKFYRNGLPLFHELRTKRAANTLFFQSIADSPTVTMQRLKVQDIESLLTAR